MTSSILSSQDTFYGTVFNPGPNGSTPTLSFGGWGDEYFDYLKFDLTNSPPAISTVQVFLNVYVSSPSVNDCLAQCNAVISDWSSSTLTRTNTPADSGFNYGSLQSTAIAGWNITDITTLYKSWKNGTLTNFGLKITPTITDNQNNGTFDSMEGTHPPYLSVIFTTSNWTNVGKPSGTMYINVNPQGKEQYDQSSILYDDVGTYYDGVNSTQWSDVSKPVGPIWTPVAKPT